MSEGGTAGLAIPYDIDPSLIITAGVQSAAMLQVASTPLTTTANWQTFSAAGTTFEWVGEVAVARRRCADFPGSEHRHRDGKVVHSCLN
jgi:hypothetical protein